MELELPKTTKLGDIDWLAIERYTSRSPYVLCIEAFKDGQWILVGGQDESTVNLKKHQIIFTKPELATNRLRFRCTSLLGAIVADRHDEKPISLNGFFND